MKHRSPGAALALALALALASSPALAGIPEHHLVVTATPDGVPSPHGISATLPAVDEPERSWFGVVRDAEGTALLQVHVDSHAGPGGTWHEVLSSNGSIETAGGFWSGEYSVEIDGHLVKRAGALFYDGTGYLEVLGEPAPLLDPVTDVHPASGYLAPLWKLLADPAERDPYMAGIRSSAPAPGLEAFPHGETWDAGDWHQVKFDTAYNTHQTGSPSNGGYVRPRAARYAALVALGSGPSDAALADGWRRAIWGKLGQQSRRPIHFYHDADGEVWRADEWPGVTMGEYGPSGTWSATELWGRAGWTKEQKQQGKWNGWDLEHLELHTQLAGWTLFGSRSALRDMRHKVEASLTHPHMKTSKETSPRVYGWGLQSLSFAAEADPDPDRAARYAAGADFLVGYFHDHVRHQPRWSIQSTYSTADGRHLIPSPGELAQYFEWAGWPWPDDDEAVTIAEATAIEKQAILDQLVEEGAPQKEVDAAAYAAGEAKNAIVWAASSWVGKTYGTKSQWEMLRVWGYVPCFQVGSIAAGLHAYARLPTSDPDQVRAVANELIGYLVLEARALPDEVPDGAVPTFWYDTAVWLPGRDVGTGTDTTGVVTWVAGGLGGLGQWIPLPWRAHWRAAVDSVYRRSKYSKPGVYLSGFETWYLAYAAEADTPPLE